MSVTSIMNQDFCGDVDGENLMLLMRALRGKQNSYEHDAMRRSRFD
jgi:hypothetical protein